MYGEILPPHDTDAEEAVIGSLLIDGTAIYKIAAFLQEQDFHSEPNREIYRSCLELYRRNDAINQITIAQELARREKLEACGGSANLSHLIAICPTPLDIEHYAHIVYRLSVMRQIISAGERIRTIGYESGPDVEESLGQAESILFRLRHGQSRRDLTHIRHVLDRYFETAPVSPEGVPEELPYVLSGFAGLDEFLGGFRRSDLVIVGGRPSMGKTSLALSVARNAAVEHGACIALFSLEMSREPLVLRLLSNESGVNSRRIRPGLHNEDEERRIMEAIGILAESQIYIDDTPMLRMSEIRGKAVRLDYEHSIDLIIVDYLQLMQGDRRVDNRVQEVSEISRSLKGLARELNVPVIAVSQLSRAVEWRASHRPQLSDLRESGSIEQDADVVLFIYRDEYYNPNETESREQADIIIAKHRNGPTGRIKFRFRHELARFENLTSEEPSLL